MATTTTTTNYREEYYSSESDAKGREAQLKGLGYRVFTVSHGVKTEVFIMPGRNWDLSGVPEN